MRIYERDGVKYVETGEIAEELSRAVFGRPYLTSKDEVRVDDGEGFFRRGVRILRPATPEEVARYGEKNLHCNACVQHSWAVTADPQRADVGMCPACAIAKPKPEKKDEKPVRCTCGSDQMAVQNWSHRLDCAYYKSEQEKQARAADAKDGVQNPLAQATKLESAKPAAPPAILPTWTWSDLRAYADANHIYGFNNEEELRGRVFSHMNRKPEPKPDARPDIVQRDARSDSFVWRRDWRVGR